MRFNDAYKMVFAKRDQLQINEGFVRQLQEFEKKLFEEGKWLLVVLNKQKGENWYFMVFSS